ncbi:MAG: hypothetical protein A3E58_02105 [Candidatus Spechtbacteria bacterium RIFCSPHIGHO2_12_FULL_38_30]|nr:MAG: hypothetical protein A3E58_02105 [Candidatus Spechtbacteria bacterium RIFCSPHIGHO2_12_FULL_38_30]
MSKFFTFSIAIFIFLFLAVFGIFYMAEVLEDKNIDITDLVVNSYNSCIEAEGSVILESYPAQCRTKDGKSFTEYIGNELEVRDIIFTDFPRPNQEISSPLTVLGQARGNWYFEASFPLRLLNASGEEIAVGVAQAQGEWMTAEFVPFRARLEFSVPILSKSGTLVLEKDNPSGLSQNDQSLVIPIKFISKASVSKRQKNGCVISGCSNQICSDKEVVTSCEYLEEYACYTTADCEKQEDGECGWTITSEVQICLTEN